MFLLKKILSQCLYPLSLCLGLLILGLILLWSTRKQRLGRTLATLGTVLLLLLSFSFTSALLLTPLERRHPALLHPETLRGEGTSAPWIVVLGGGHVSDPALPPTSQISAPALSRVVEGVRLNRALPGSRLLLSGGGGTDPVPEAEVMARIAVGLGVRPEDIRLETESRDTAEEAEIIAGIVGQEKIILVTSAAHMPRSLALFRKRGLTPVPAPCDFLVKEGLLPPLSRFFPRPGSLLQAEAAMHEYLGLAWAWLRGLI